MRVVRQGQQDIGIFGCRAEQGPEQFQRRRCVVRVVKGNGVHVAIADAPSLKRRGPLGCVTLIFRYERGTLSTEAQNRHDSPAPVGLGFLINRTERPCCGRRPASSWFGLRLFKTLTASRLLMSLIALACVGCGGSGSGPSTVGPNPVLPPESRDFALSDANAVNALSVTLDLVERAWGAGESIAHTAYILDGRRERVVRIPCANNPNFQITWSHVDNDEDDEISQGDSVKSSDGCFSGSYDIELVVERMQSQYLGVFEIDGTVEFSAELPQSDVEGEFDLVHSRRPTRSWSLTNTSVTRAYDDATKHSVSDTRIEKAISGRRYTIEIEGELESDRLGGSFSFETREALSGVDGRFPKAGTFGLDADSSAVRVMPSSDPVLVREHAEYQVDADGTGQFGTRTVVRWRLIMVGALVNLLPNQPHELTNVRISPEEPDTTDELKVTYDISNPDNDELLTTIEWFRNGNHVASYEGYSLPSDQTTKGDVIEVRLAVSDGIVTIRGSASITILDAPATVDVTSPPETVVYGERLTFHAAASDPDGDPLDDLVFVIDHGPAGMTIDPASGVVTWEASGPMFARSMEVNWSISVDVPDARAASGSIRVEDPTRQYPLLRADMQVPRRASGIVVGDFDGDGDEEVLASHHVMYEFEFDGEDYRQSWAHPYVSASVMATGDVDGDGRHEIFIQPHTIVPRHPIIRLDGVERRMVDSVEVILRVGEWDTSVECEAMELADLNSDGSMEIVCLVRLSDGYVLVVLAADGLEELWRSKVESFGDARSFLGNLLEVGNVDGDPALEIVTRSIGSMHVYDGITSDLEWSVDGDLKPWFVVADIDGDGIEEIVASDESRVVAYSAVTKSSIGEIGLRGAHLAAGDVSGDGRDQIVFYNNDALHVYDYDSASRSFDRLFHYEQYSLNPSWLDVGDIDDDGDVEIIWGATNGNGADEMAVVGLYPQEHKEWSSHGIQLDGPFVGGQSARDPLEGEAQIFATAKTNEGWGGTRLISMTAEGDVVIGREIGGDRFDWDRTAVHVADYDHDGTDEVFVSLPTDRWATGRTGLTSIYDVFEQRSEWTTPQHWPAEVLKGGDFNGDGSADLVVFAPPSIHVFDVAGQSSIWDADDEVHRASEAMEVVDLDGDGTPEILVSDDSDLHALTRATRSGEFRRTSTYSGPRTIRGITAGDTDGDGEVEILILAYGEVHRLDSRLQLLNKFDVYRYASTILIEKSSSERKNLVISEDARIVVLDPKSGVEVWRSPDLIGDVSKGSVQFLDVDGTERISIGTEFGMYLTR